jgi:hypothetical protein
MVFFFLNAIDHKAKATNLPSQSQPIKKTAAAVFFIA